MEKRLNALLKGQLGDFKESGSENSEHYRYTILEHWIQERSAFSDQEVEDFIDIALDDSDKVMAGSAVKMLFTSSQLTEKQFCFIRGKLPEFGEWTNKLIRREELVRKLRQGELSHKLLSECLDYTKQFKEYVLVRIIIEKTNDPELLEYLSSELQNKSITNLISNKRNKKK